MRGRGLCLCPFRKSGVNPSIRIFFVSSGRTPCAIRGFICRFGRFRPSGKRSRPGALPRPTCGFTMVGDTGIEPVASSVSGKRAPAAPIAHVGGDDRNRTGDKGFAGPCLTAWPRRRHSSRAQSPFVKKKPPPRRATASHLRWSGRRDSNPRPQPWQGCALPTEPLPHAGCYLSKLSAHVKGKFRAFSFSPQVAGENRAG